MKKLIFVHGWGFDSRIWRSVLEYLPTDTLYECLDLGFMGESTLECEFPEECVFVGHSLGVLWCLKNFPQMAGLVAINGFDCFFRHTLIEPMVKMQENLQNNLQMQMSSFYRQVGTKLPKDISFDKDRLVEGLNWLITWDAEIEHKMAKYPITALVARNDKITSAQMSEAIWSKDTLIWHENGGHVLPLVQPGFCAEKIQSMINAL